MGSGAGTIQSTIDLEQQAISISRDIFNQRVRFHLSPKHSYHFPFFETFLIPTYRGTHHHYTLDNGLQTLGAEK